MDKYILITGDSFCANRKEGSWGSHLENNLGHKLLGNGYPGCSWWLTRKELINTLKSCTPNIMVFCHTEPYRIFSDKQDPLNLNSVYKHNIKYGIEYYENIFSADFHNWAQEMWFRELDFILSNYKSSKIIHIKNFPAVAPYRFKTGITIGQKHTLVDYKVGNSSSNENSPNHLSIESNLKLATLLLDIINNYENSEKIVELRL